MPIYKEKTKTSYPSVYFVPHSELGKKIKSCREFFVSKTNAGKLIEVSGNWVRPGNWVRRSYLNDCTAQMTTPGKSLEKYTIMSGLDIAIYLQIVGASLTTVINEDEMPAAEAVGNLLKTRDVNFNAGFCGGVLHVWR